MKINNKCKIHFYSFFLISSCYIIINTHIRIKNIYIYITRHDFFIYFMIIVSTSFCIMQEIKYHRPYYGEEKNEDIGTSWNNVYGVYRAVDINYTRIQKILYPDISTLKTIQFHVIFILFYFLFLQKKMIHFIARSLYME